jgi:hypothetical protein
MHPGSLWRARRALALLALLLLLVGVHTSRATQPLSANDALERVPNSMSVEQAAYPYPEPESATPTEEPTEAPTEVPTEATPTDVPTEQPTEATPTDVPTEQPTEATPTSTPGPTSVVFADAFDRPDTTDLGPLWTEVVGDWDIVAGQLHNFDRGYAWVTTTPSFTQTNYVIEVQARGFGPTQGPSPSDSLTLTFGGDSFRFNDYRLSYFPLNPLDLGSGGLLMLQKGVDNRPDAELRFETLATAGLTLPPAALVGIRVVRAGDVLHVFVDEGGGYTAQPVLQASDASYAELGRVGWLLQSQAPGDFFIEQISVTAPR